VKSGVICLCAGLLTGCAGVWPNTPGQGPQVPSLEVEAEPQRGKITTGVPQQELRLRIERFADEFQDAVSEPLTEVLESDATLRRRKLALDMKYVYSSVALTIASGTQPAVAILDMVVFISLTRDTVERWGVEFAGRRQTGRLLAVFREYEEKIWKIARSIVTPEQETKIRAFLVEWRENNPDKKFVENIRLSEFIDALDIEDRSAARGLFADINKATAAADQALELAERLTYFFQRAPLIWRMHAQLGFFEVISQPEMQGLLVNADQISDSADRLSQNVDRLTNILIEGPQSPEEAALFENLEGGETRVRALMSDLQQTMEQANALAQNVDRLAVRFDVGGPPEPGEKPFDITEYESLASQVTSMSSEMTQLVQNLNQLLASPNVQERLPLAVGSAQDMSQDFVRYLVLLALVLVFSSIMGAVFAVLGYRYLAARLDARLDKHHHA
jgi:hypothetical protein